MDKHEKQVLVGAKIILENEILHDHVLVFTDRINEVLSKEAFVEHLESTDVSLYDIIEFNGYVSPGFVDIHVHGAGGADTMDCSIKSLQTISDKLIQSGTTAYLATTMTMAQETIEEALKQVRSYMKKQDEDAYPGSEIVGVHLEGPFISPAFKGAQAAENIQAPTTQWIKPYFDIIKIITLAPEMDEDFKFIHEMKDSGVVLSMGHTGCDFETACSAYDAGVEHVTHCFNAMTGLHHRNPGAVGATFAKPFTAEIITDGVHVHPGFVDTFIRIKTPEKVVLVTDSMRASFLGDGIYDLGGQEVTVKDGAPRLSDGTIAGSVHRMDQALINVKDHTGYALNEIINMLSLNPAKRIGLDSKMGSIKEGKLSNLVLLTDDFKVKAVYIKGRKKFESAQSNQEENSEYNRR